VTGPAPSVAAWLSSREPAPPPALLERVQSLAGSVSDGDIPTTLLAGAQDALERVVREGGPERGTALDLLAVDALVTYAFEAASAEPESLPERAAEAMTRLSRAVAR
jgi:hypothetical protein